MNGDNIAVLDAKVVANNAVQPGAAIIKVIVGQNNKHGVLSLLASDKDGIAAEELKSLHRVV